LSRHRRGFGEGSIYQSGEGWRGSISLGNGKREYFRGRTRADVAAQIRIRQAEIEDNLPRKDKNLRLAKYLDRWLDAVKPPRLRMSTWRGYESWTRGKLIPALGHHPLVALTPSDVEKFLTDEIAAGLAPRSASHMRAILRAALAQAVRDGLILRNVAQLAKLPAKPPAAEIEPLTPAETGILLDAIKGNRLEALYLLSLATGIRQGEALGLCWDCVDLDAGLVHIRRTLYRDSRAKSFQLNETTKTARSRRTLPLPATVKIALQHHLEAQGFEQKAVAATAELPASERPKGKRSEWANDWGLVFATDEGAPLHASTVTHDFQELLASLGLPRKRFYDLRHQCASFLIAEGAELRDVMEQLGHSQISLTANVYGHLFDERKRELADLMDDKLRALSGSA